MSRYNLRSKKKGSKDKGKKEKETEVSGDKLKDYMDDNDDMDLEEQAEMMEMIEELLSKGFSINENENEDDDEYDPKEASNQLAFQLLQSIMAGNEDEDPFDQIQMTPRQKKLFQKLEKKIEEEEPTPQRILNSKMPNSEKIQMIKTLLSYTQLQDDSMEYWMFRDMMHENLKEWETLSPLESKEMRILMKQVKTKKSIPKQIVQLKAAPEVKKGILTLYTTSDRSSHTHKARLEMAMKIPYTKVRPFGEGKTRHAFLKHVKDQLDEKLYGLEDVKKELLMTLNIRLSNPRVSTAILLNGKAGVGKTMISHVLAEAVGLYFYKISLSNITHPQALTGGESIWEGSNSSIITQALIEGDCKNPLILLDEIDKSRCKSGLNNGVENALLQILDPTQNDNYRDLNIPEVPIDLSAVWWIATSNSIENISKPLMSRLRLIEVPDYSAADLKKITRGYVFPGIAKKCGIKKPIQIEEPVLNTFLAENAESIDSLGIRFIEGYFEKIIGSILLDEVLANKEQSVVQITNDHLTHKKPSDHGGMMYL